MVDRLANAKLRAEHCAHQCQEYVVKCALVRTMAWLPGKLSARLTPCQSFLSAPSLNPTMPPIVQGQIFATLGDFKEALRNWAIERNWTPHILDSDSHRVRAGCRSSPDCPFRIRANYSVKRGDAKVTTCDDNHTCEPFRASAELRPHQDIKRAETGKLKFLLEAVPKLMNVSLDTNILEIIEVVERKYGQKIPTRQAQKVKASLTDRVKGPCRHCHQLGHTKRHCPQLQAPNQAPTTFPHIDREIPDFANEDGDDATYADGGLELDPGNDRTLNPMNYTANHQPNGHGALFTRAPPQQAANPTAPILAEFNNIEQNDIPMDPTMPSAIQQLTSREAPVPEPPAIVQVSQTVAELNVAHNQQTPQETRLEAAKLMQQAARLMQEAARLNAEAARLTASVASA